MLGLGGNLSASSPVGASGAAPPSAYYYESDFTSDTISNSGVTTSVVDFSGETNVLKVDSVTQLQGNIFIGSPFSGLISKDFYSIEIQYYVPSGSNLQRLRFYKNLGFATVAEDVSVTYDTWNTYTINSFQADGNSNYNYLYFRLDTTAAASTDLIYIKSIRLTETIGVPTGGINPTVQFIDIEIPLASTPSAAYSLRRLFAHYDGNAIRVRRSSDNSEQDIGFSYTGELDTSSLTTFCSGTDGFIATWYDQSGNGNDAVQATTGYQPKIYDSVTGVLLENTKPAMDATNRRLLASSVSVTGQFGSIAVGNLNTSVVSAFWAILDTFNDGPEILSIGSNQIRFALDANDTNISQSTAQVSIFADYNGSTKITSIDGTATSSSVTTTCNATGLEIGFRLSGNSYTGTMQEIIIWSASQSANRTGIESNINQYYTIY